MRMIFMAKMTIQIELNEQDIDKLIDEIDEEEDDDCNCNECGYHSDNNPPETTYTKEEMLYANEDELNWDKSFYNKHKDLFDSAQGILARYDLEQRIKLGEKIVEQIKRE
jgi:hypothetical protein